MNAVANVDNNYLGTMLQTSRGNTVTQAANAAQSGFPVAANQLVESAQQFQDQVRNVGVELYTRELKLQTLDTYRRGAESAPDYNTAATAEDDKYSVYSFDAANVNEARSTAQERALQVAVYEQQGQAEQAAYTNPPHKPVSVYV